MEKNISMTPEQKNLLLKELCARLPYHVIVEYKGANVDLTQYARSVKLESCKPYLRPMSSMTDEDVKEIQKINWQFCKPENGLIECFVGDADDGYCSVSQMARIINYLNAHHFDYLGLIPMGLAIEAPKDMYKTE